MVKVKASLLTSLRKKPKLSKSKNKLVRYGKVAQKFVKKLPETVGRKERGFTGGHHENTNVNRIGKFCCRVRLY